MKNSFAMCRLQLKKRKKRLRLRYLSKGPWELFIKQNIIQNFEQNRLRNSEVVFLEEGFIIVR